MYVYVDYMDDCFFKILRRLPPGPLLLVLLVLLQLLVLVLRE